MKCPGQDTRNLRVDEIKCSCCGYGVEVFSDEVKARCPRCGKVVFREKMPSCIDWCAYAEQCVGRERLKELVRSLKKNKERI